MNQLLWIEIIAVVFCHRTLGGNLRNNSRILKVSSLKDDTLEGVQKWCVDNNTPLNDIDKHRICGRDYQKMNRNLLDTIFQEKQLHLGVAHISPEEAKAHNTTTIEMEHSKIF